MTFAVLRYFVKYALDTLLRILPRTVAPSRRDKKACAPFSPPPTLLGLLDLSRHHYRFILSVPAEGNIAKKAPFEARVPRHFGRNLLSWKSSRQNEIVAAPEKNPHLQMYLWFYTLPSTSCLHVPSIDSGWPARCRRRQFVRREQRRARAHFTSLLTHSVNGSYFGSSFERRRNSSQLFAPLQKQRKERRKERKEEIALQT